MSFSADGDGAPDEGGGEGAGERGASTQVGAILLFGLIIVLVAFWQAQVIPAENAEIEYAHNQRVQDDLQEVRGAVVSAPGSSSASRSVAVDMAPSYPPRALFVNPTVPQGTLKTVGTTDPDVNITIVNATALDAEVADYWNGSNRSFNSGGLLYDPGYAIYTSAPATVYENSVLYNDEGRTNVTIAGQTLIDGRRITLVALNGSLSRTQTGSYTLDIRTVSASSRTVSVTNTSGNLTLRFATRLSAAKWRALLEPENVSNGGHVLVRRIETHAIPVEGFRVVEIPLEGNVTYELRLAKVGVGSGVEDEGRHYVVPVSGNETSVASGESQELVVEVRDRFNNPVSGVTVNVSDGTALGSVTPVEATTGEDGRATFTFDATTTGTAEITFNISKSATEWENVTFEVTVTGSGGGGGPGGTTCTGGAGEAAYFVCWEDPSGQPGTVSGACDASDCTLNASKSFTMNLTAVTTGTAQDATIDYAVNDTSLGELSPWSGTTNDSGENVTTFEVNTSSFSGGDTKTVKVYAASGGSGDLINVTVATFPFVDYVDSFHDGVDTCPESGSENCDLPPATPEGNVSFFPDMQAADGQFGFVDEEDTDPRGGGNVAFDVNVSTKINNVPTGRGYTLEIKYRSNVSATNCDADGEDYTVTPWDNTTAGAGSAIDSTYTLPNTAGTVETVEFDLTSAETAYIENNGELVLLWEDATPGDGSLTCYDVFYVRLLTIP